MAPKQKRQKVTKYCLIQTCYNKSKSRPNLTFFSLPKDAKRRQQWLLLCDRDDLLYRENLNYKSYCICADHFDKSAIKNIKHLDRDALPTIKMPNQPQTEIYQSDNSEEYLENVPTKEQTQIKSTVGSAQSGSTSKSQTKDDLVNKSTQTSENLSNEDPMKRKRKLDKPRVPKNKRRRLGEVMKIEEEFDGKNASIGSDTKDEIIRRFGALIDWQNKIKSTFKGFGAEYKIFSLNLLCTSPHAYQSLQTILKLPSKTALKKLKYNIGPKLNDQVFNSLSFQIKSLPEKAKYCTICVNKTQLKPSLYYEINKDELIGCSNINGKVSPEIACNSYVIMLQGIYLNWKQPIAYAFFTNIVDYPELDAWINDVIQKLFESGIEVKALISNQESEFDEYAKVTKNITVDKPYFVVNGRKIFYIVDVPHLVKRTRDHLISNNFLFEGNQIKWDHVKTLFDYQKDKNFILIPKMTMAHIMPNRFERKKLQYATQIFSNSVSAALETYIDFGKITEEARATAKFLKIMDDLFDVLNSSNIKSDKQLQTAFCMSTDQMKVLEDAQNMFANIESALSANTESTSPRYAVKEIKTFRNFQITINSILLLFKDLKSEGSQCLWTRRLNKENMDVFIGEIKQEVGCAKPTPIQFTRAFSKLFSSYMLKTSQSTKHEPNISQLLVDTDEIINKITTSPKNAKTSLVHLNGDIDYRLDLPNDHALTFIASFLLLKCLEKHSDCMRLTEEIKSVPRLLNEKLMIYYRGYVKHASILKNLQMPSREFEQCIQILDTVFTQNFKIFVGGNIGSALFELLKEVHLLMFPS